MEGLKPLPIDDRENRECASTGCNLSPVISGPCSGLRGFSSSEPSANVSDNFYSHSFTLSNNLIERDRRGLPAAAKPRSDHKFSWTNFLQINALNNQKQHRDDQLAAILSEKVTQFLLSSVREGEMYKVSISSIALSWGDLASGVSACLYVSLTVTSAVGKGKAKGLEKRVSSPQCASESSSGRRKKDRTGYVLEEEEEDDYGTSKDKQETIKSLNSGDQVRTGEAEKRKKKLYENPAGIIRDSRGSVMLPRSREAVCGPASHDSCLLYTSPSPRDS